MFRNTFQSGFLSILYAIGSKPLQIWRKNINNGYVKRITDFEMQSSVIEICGANVSTCFLSCPSNPKQTLGVKMPFLVLLIKYLKKYFTFEVQVIDDKNVKRRFRASNYQSNTRVKPFICTIPMKLDEGWNQIHFNLTDFTRRAYGTNYLETLRVQIHANCRIRRIYFTDQLLSSKSIPDEYRAFSNANDDNAEEQYQNQMPNDPNAQMQGEGEEQYQAEYHEENQEEQLNIMKKIKKNIMWNKMKNMLKNIKKYKMKNKKLNNNKKKMPKKIKRNHQKKIINLKRKEETHQKKIKIKEEKMLNHQLNK